MHMGFKICIQADLSAEEMIIAKRKANDFIKYALEHNLKWQGLTRGGWRGKGTNLKRGRLGGPVFAEGYDGGYSPLRFRRRQRNKRVFEICREDNFIQRDGSPLPTKTCKCGDHLGDTKVKRVKDYPVIDYCTIGDIMETKYKPVPNCSK